MMFAQFLRIILALFYFEINQQRVKIDHSQAIHYSAHKTKKRLKRKRRRQIVYKGHRQFVKRGLYRDSKPKDVRFSDQKKLRRMFRGV